MARLHTFFAAFGKRPAAALVLLLVAFGASSALAKLPQRNMTVELWVLSEEQAAQRYPPSSANTVRTLATHEDLPEVQKVFVMNGERAQLKLNAAVPVQWVKSAVTSSSASAASNGDSSSTQGQGLSQSLTWADTGQSISALVRWPGGAAPAVLELEVDVASLPDNARGNLPNPGTQRLATTVAVPLGVWTTIAVTGGRVPVQQPGTYSAGSKGASEQKLIQVRVLAP
ncbi:hypothetical protein [Rhodoferax aquaticus]|uniref:Molecular chaperone n=1 Tax=Rhodoferax aquaticus TaxID=2527691 RepID=A0A515ER54_9BURK|nr:hypothetical protein [Rhodoferax aquaticus]QDL55120.1 hypothetical protein EXZ61_13615 [Rhodoferax aquaticus]